MITFTYDNGTLTLSGSICGEGQMKTLREQLRVFAELPEFADTQRRTSQMSRADDAALSVAYAGLDLIKRHSEDPGICERYVAPSQLERRFKRGTMTRKAIAVLAVGDRVKWQDLCDLSGFRDQRLLKFFVRDTRARLSEMGYEIKSLDGDYWLAKQEPVSPKPAVTPKPEPVTPKPAAPPKPEPKPSAPPKPEPKPSATPKKLENFYTTDAYKATQRLRSATTRGVAKMIFDGRRHTRAKIMETYSISAVVLIGILGEIRRDLHGKDLDVVSDDTDSSVQVVRW